jgi:transposase
MPLAMLRQRREYPTYPDALLLWVFSSGSTCRSQNRDVRCRPNGRVLWQGKVPSEPEPLVKRLAEWSGVIDLAGIEACPLSEWLLRGLREAGNTGRVR